ncbi:kinase-like protein, partial [Teratosphaeria nubilosa]
DVGAGSKARRLSVALPQEFRVDVVPLDQYFSLLNRKNPKQIGEGGAAEVQLMKARNSLSDDPAKSRDKVYAVKKFRPWEEAEETEFEYRRKIKSEYAIAKALDHPNVVKTYALCTSERGTRWHHVMEYCEYGDLNDLVNMGYMSRRDKDCMFKQLLRGVEYLHGHGIAHRDIKSENLLIANTGCLKLADFGTSEVFEGVHPGLRNCRRPSITKNDKEPKLCEPGLVGSKPYMAPEIVAHEKRYDPRAVDVWSSAIVYMSLIKGGTPWELADPVSCKNYGIYAGMWDEWITEYGEDAELNPHERKLPAYANAKRGMATGGYTPEEKALILSMLHPDPEKRMKIKDALESKVVTEFECCQQDGYSDDIKKRQKKSNHNCHAPPKD